MKTVRLDVRGEMPACFGDKAAWKKGNGREEHARELTVNGVMLLQEGSNVW